LCSSSPASILGEPGKKASKTVEGNLVWGKASFSNGNYVYIRGRDTYTKKNNSSAYTGTAPGSNNDGPSLDMAYFSMRHKEYTLNLGSILLLVKALLIGI